MPREIMRLVSVTTPAPVTTPRIPSSGCAETSVGTAAPTARAISIGDGRTVTLEAAILFRLPPRPDGCNHGESGAQVGGKGAIVQPSLDRDALHHLRDINERDDLRARRNKLSCPDLAFAHSALAGCVNFRVAKIHHSCREVRLLRPQISLKLHILRLEDCFRTPLGFGSEFAAEQHRLGLFEIGVTARELRRQALVVRHRGFHPLLRRRMSLVQPLLAFALGVGANQVSSYCFFSSFSRGDLRLCLIDTGKRFGYTRVLQL